MPSPLPRRLTGAPALVMSVALALGALGAVGAYRAVAQAGATSNREVPVAAVPAAPATPPARRRTVVRWAPCKPPAVLRHGVCVTERIREVVLAAPAPAVRTTAAAPASHARNHGGAGTSRGTGSHAGHSPESAGGRGEGHSQDDSQEGPEQESPEPPEVETGD